MSNLLPFYTGFDALGINNQTTWNMVKLGGIASRIFVVHSLYANRLYSTRLWFSRLYVNRL